MAASNTSKATSFESANPFASSKGDHANSGPSAGNAERYHEGKPNSHGPLDSKDQRSIANRLANEEQGGKEEDDFETKAFKKDPTLPAQLHGNEPSKGAKIDKELQEEEEEELRKKGKA
ncbi:MAG: hypothetical protein M1824_004744 [Vezdaea acicularis]|nr:MAG: hypothetical protein M1824_004744 [Vezdaea acicularis]